MNCLSYIGLVGLYIRSEICGLCCDQIVCMRGILYSYGTEFRDWVFNSPVYIYMFVWCAYMYIDLDSALCRVHTVHTIVNQGVEFTGCHNDHAAACASAVWWCCWLSCMWHFSSLHNDHLLSRPVPPPIAGMASYPCHSKLFSMHGSNLETWLLQIMQPKSFWLMYISLLTQKSFLRRTLAIAFHVWLAKDVADGIGNCKVNDYLQVVHIRPRGILSEVL